MKGLVLIALSGLILAIGQARILPQEEDSLWEVPEVPVELNEIQTRECESMGTLFKS